MHFDDSKGDDGRKDGDGVRSKVTQSGAVATPLRAAIQPPKPLIGFGGRYRPRVFRSSSSVAGILGCRL